MEQSHFGKGDNVAGNKIIRQYTLKISVSALIVVGLIILGYKFSDSFLTFFYNEKAIFEENDSRFKILIIPFSANCRDPFSTNINQELITRLNDLNISDSLDIFPFIYPKKPSINFNRDSAKFLLKLHNADQVIYGYYCYSGDSKEKKYEISYNWLTGEKWKFGLDDNTLVNNNFKVVSINELRNGEIQKTTTDLIPFFVSGLLSLSKGNHNKAIKRFNIVLDRDSSNSKAFYLKATAYHFLKEYEKAINQYDFALNYDSNFVYSIIDKGMAFYELGRHKEALSYLDIAIKKDSSNYIAYYNKGVILDSEALFQKAINSFQKAFDKSLQKSKNSILMKGIALSELEYIEEAMDCFDKALELDENFEQAYYNLALMYDYLGKLEEGLILYDKAIKINPLYVRAIVNKGTNLAMLGKKKNALTILEYSLSIDSSNNIALAEIGVIYGELKEYEKALFYLDLSLAVDSTYFLASYNRNVILNLSTNNNPK